MAEFHANTRVREGAAIIDLVGDLTGRSAEALAGTHRAAVADGPTVLVLNFTDTDYINSSGIAALVSILAEAREVGRRVCAVALTEHYRHVFDLTRLSDFMDFYVTEDAAVAAVATVGKGTV